MSLTLSRLIVKRYRKVRPKNYKIDFNYMQFQILLSHCFSQNQISSTSISDKLV
ncbi:unnamed protein product [Paramecium octaurelia]|uniref:Uncharacterized protein n=1 Tax=Paramecium octaurelia TaxID=43137 RepID=A0A8S1TYY3_PAROT|nr:unnamed protein product [Paramecium octaurelia]